MLPIECLEVAVRAAIINRIAVVHGSHFYLEKNVYENEKFFKKTIDDIEQAQHDTIKHYHNNYYIPHHPPVWVVNEALSIGKLSRFFSNLHVSLRKCIEPDFGYDEKLLGSWFRSIAWLRNKCAHHNRVWDAPMHVDAPSSSTRLPELINRTTFYGRAIIIIALLKTVKPGDAWKHRLIQLIKTTRVVNPSKMGFPTGWDTFPFWI